MVSRFWDGFYAGGRHGHGYFQHRDL